MRRRYEVIGSNKVNPWFIKDYIFADDEEQANRIALERFGYFGFRTVQLASKQKGIR